MKIDFTSLQAKINFDLKMQSLKKILVLRFSYQNLRFVMFDAVYKHNNIIAFLFDVCEVKVHGNYLNGKNSVCT